MSDLENENGIEEIKTIAQIKQEKKDKKKIINPEVSKVRSENMKKAIAQKKKNFEDKNKLKLIEYNISDLINNNESTDDEKEEIKVIKKENKIEVKEDKNNDNYKNMLDTINNTILNINKKVEKLYIMKKSKPIKQPQPVYINKENNNNSGSTNDLLNAIKNKMLNN